MFEQNKRDTWRRLGDFMKPYNFNSLQEGYKQMQEGALKAIIYSKADIEYQWHRNLFCDIQIADRISNDVLTFAVTKGSHWNAPISHLLRKYQEKGILDNIKWKYFAPKCTKRAPSQKQFSILYLSGACIMLVLGIIASMLFFAMEHIIKLCIKNYSKKKKPSYTISNETIDKTLDQL